MNNVLIIEDDKEICVMIKDHLEKYNYQVFFTLTGANAIERIKELSPDLIILDLMLPFISGDELIRNIRKFSDVPVIVVSAKSLTFNKVELLRLGADDYLTKPFDLDELLARIERNLLRSQKDTPNLCLTFGELSINTWALACGTVLLALESISIFLCVVIQNTGIVTGICCLYVFSGASVYLMLWSDMETVSIPLKFFVYGNPMYYWMNFSSCRTMGIIEHLPFYFIGCISLLIVGGLIMIRKEIK